jgi:C1A family cysteine protease
MRVTWLAAWLLLQCAAPSLAQGLIPETLTELTNAPDAPELRSALPVQIDLTAQIPTPRNQGASSTCVSWATTYGAASNALRRAGRQAITLSPSSTYNMVSDNRFCLAGTKISATLDFLRASGALPIEHFAFDGAWCGRRPTEAERKQAEGFRIRGWSKFDARDPLAVKAQLARGVPVIFGMWISSKFASGFRSAEVIQANDDPFSHHAMLVVGYDDARQAFRIQNSFGTAWGDRGYGWLAYRLWQRSVQVGFVID